MNRDLKFNGFNNEIHFEIYFDLVFCDIFSKKIISLETLTNGEQIILLSILWEFLSKEVADEEENIDDNEIKQVLLLDEPFAALDPIAIIELKEMLRHLKDKGISIFITDHNVKETLDIVDRSYIINSGELIAEGSPQEIVENS